MKSIRRGVFETNSSSTHSMTICAKEDYEAWRKGKVLFDENKNVFLPEKEVLEKLKDELDEDLNEDGILQEYGYYTYDEFWNKENELESFEEEYTTKGGEVIKIFGSYGYNG